jgi:hypothetical protein
MSKGLRITPSNAVKHGSILGNGIYFADRFSKAG